MPNRYEDDAAAFVAACSEELILPPGHVATVLDRIGYRETAQLYLKWSLAKKKESKGAAAARGAALREKDKEVARNLHTLREQRGNHRPYRDDTP